MRPWQSYAWWRRALTGGLSLWLLMVPGIASSGTPLSSAEPVLEELSKQVLDQSQPESERLELVVVLGQWGTEQVLAPLVALLSDPLPSIRTGSARALGWKGNVKAVAALKTRLEAPDEVASVRVAVLEALGRIGDDSARAVVLSASRDPDAAVRGAALWGLTFEGLVSQTDRIPLLRQIAADTKLDPYMRSQSIQALGDMNDTGSSDLLLGLLEHEPPSPMPPPEAKAENELMAIRYRQARDVRAWAARTLWVLDVRAAVPLLVKAADDPSDFFLRIVSVVALGSWKAPEALPVLVRRLDDPFDRTRIAALWGLGAIGDRSAVDPVVARLSDKVADVRVQAVKTLAELGDKRVRPELLALQQKEPHPLVQEALDKALAKLK